MVPRLITILNQLDDYYNKISQLKSAEKIINNQNCVSSILRDFLVDLINTNHGITTLSACSRLLYKVEEKFILKSSSEIHIFQPDYIPVDQNAFDGLVGFENRLYNIKFGFNDFTLIDVYRPIIKSKEVIENRILHSKKIEKRKIISDLILLAIIFDQIDRFEKNVYIDIKDYRKHHFKIQYGGLIGMITGILCSIPVIGNVWVPPSFQRFAAKFDTEDKIIVFLEICERFISDEINKSSETEFSTLAKSLGNFDTVSLRFYNAIEKHFPLILSLNTFELSQFFLNIYPKLRDRESKKFGYFHSNNWRQILDIRIDDTARLLLSE
jgi:hypothetical protein